MILQFEALFLGRMQDPTLTLRDRVVLRRAIPRLRRELERGANEYVAMHMILEVWGAYFCVLASEVCRILLHPIVSVLICA